MNGMAAFGKVCEYGAQYVGCWLTKKVNLLRMTDAVQYLRVQVPLEIATNTVPNVVCQPHGQSLCALCCGVAF